MTKKNTTDPFSRYAAKVVAEFNVYLVLGFVFVAIALVSFYIDESKVYPGAGLVWVLVGYYGVILSIFAVSGRSLKQKIGAAIAVPVVVALGVWLYLQ